MSDIVNEWPPQERRNVKCDRQVVGGSRLRDLPLLERADPHRLRRRLAVAFHEVARRALGRVP